MNLMSGLSSMLAMGLLTPVQSMLFLILLFVSTAMSLYSQGFVLMGMLYMLVYVGAMAMLFLFMLSLLKMEYSPKNVMSPYMMVMLMMMSLPLDLTYNVDGMSEMVYTTSNELMMVGSLLYTDYSMLMMMTGLMLILSVMGAMSMTK
ncbi:NADH-ubiquinone oxidoreductase chain 6 (mitochondrion) [[Candida] anglica]|uniref:NADH-ubiquinone oxidoreductase chain 6 n=1 Tax=[Candida] anglica TaxID=148631 RepID=A0ABP0EPU3_9ASCO